MNDDGYDDVLVGAPFEDPGVSPDSAGRSNIFSGATGTLLWTLSSPNEEWWGRFGWSVSGTGDVDGDSRPDVIVGAYREDTGMNADAGRAYVFAPTIVLSGSVDSGTLLLNLTPCPVADAYWVYGAGNQAYFEPGLAAPFEYRLAVLPAETTMWASSAGVSNPDTTWTYQLLAVEAPDQVLCISNRLGEHDFNANAWVCH